ncbi:NAD-dependent epimerase/dehydratase family protein [Pseudomonadales bacterium]|nr:NAD-dependent epimerase/dehydratase family protein [Pseudomonadales bacterium]
MKVLILGDQGFLGKNVSDCLLARNLSIVAGNRSILNAADCSGLSRFLVRENPDVIVNCLAHVGSLNYVTENAADVLIDNLKLITALYEAVVQLPKVKLINPIANCAYPASANIMKEDELFDSKLHHSVEAYGITRRVLVLLARKMKQKYDVDSYNLIAPNMYGPYDSLDPNKAHAFNALVSKFITADQKGLNSVDIWGTGKPIREWLYVKDFPRIICELIDHDFTQMTDCREVNVAQKTGISISELAEKINHKFNSKFNLKYLTEMPDGAPIKVLDDTRFNSLFPEFRFTPMDVGLSETFHYYQNAS